MPFWLKYAVDRTHGGVLNYIGDDGVLISDDKVLWSQCRALWVFSALYNHLGGEPVWLELAARTAEFLLRYGRDREGAWVFRVTREGALLEPHQSIYVDGFAIYGLTEYVRATGDRAALQAAIETFERTSPLLTRSDRLLTKPHPIPEGLQAHGPFMIFALAYHELGLVAKSPEILKRALELAEIVMSQHLKPERRVLHEFVKPGGELDESDAGKTVIPAHAIESMWFMERIYSYHGNGERIRLALEAIKWHVELGWDDQYGGLYLAVHLEGGRPAWHRPDSKVWWTVTETLYALLRAYEVSRALWCLDWYRKVHEYAFRVFPNPERGDWYQNLDREGRRIPVVVRDLPVKDPFHLPRSLLYGLLVLRRLGG